MFYNKYMDSIKRLHRKRKYIIAIIIMVVLLCAASAVFAYNQLKPRPDSQQSPNTTEKTGEIPRGLADRLNVEATHEDPDATQTGVDGIHTSNESAPASAFPTTQPNLSVVIKSTQQIENNLAVATVVEPNASGTCTLELTRDGHQAITKTSKFSGTSCNDTSLPLTGYSPGNWNLTVKVVVASNVATATKAVTLK